MNELPEEKMEVLFWINLFGKGSGFQAGSF
jgi:hypothetical protein